MNTAQLNSLYIYS
uniref:Uncharacterized protein n=1 Tax=Arundo donax TaxID=35708 RepID=A0A0A8Y9H3_ARUDO